MTFDVAAEAYDRFMGRYSGELASAFVDFAGPPAQGAVLDVGCGPGALTGELIRRLEPARVAAVDPSESFVGAAAARHPGVDVRRGSAEDLPFPDDTFGAAFAQLAVHFMTDPVAGIREMARVTADDGVVAACVWDFAGGRAPISAFWRAAIELDPEADDESGLAGAREGHLAELLEKAGLRGIDEAALRISVEHESFDAWWEPFGLGVGPAGAYARALDDDTRSAIRDRCRQLLPDGRFALTAYAWAARGSV